MLVTLETEMVVIKRTEIVVAQNINISSVHLQSSPFTAASSGHCNGKGWWYGTVPRRTSIHRCSVAATAT
jgi:hypothetical protein